ncbi:MAG TPA: hypothetical protein VF380_03710 [Solirubrobacteraceae bacterium]
MLGVFLLAAAPSVADVPVGPCAAAIAAPGAGVVPTGLPPVGSAAPAPEQLVACVGLMPITGASYLHWLTVAQRPSAGPHAKGEHVPSAIDLRDEVLEYLITAGWLVSEAKALGIHVPASVVKREFDRIRAQQFPKRSEFQSFLRESGQTVADLLLRVERTLLSRRILQHVLAGHHSARSRQRAAAVFVKAFTARWRAQTYCASGFVVKDCGRTL